MQEIEYDADGRVKIKRSMASLVLDMDFWYGDSDYTSLGHGTEWERHQIKLRHRKQKRIRVKTTRRGLRRLRRLVKSSTRLRKKTNFTRQKSNRAHSNRSG